MRRQKWQYKQAIKKNQPKQLTSAQSPSSKMAPGKQDARGSQGPEQPNSPQCSQPSPRAEIGDPFSSQSSGVLEEDGRGAISPSPSLSTGASLGGQGRAGSPGSSMDRNMAELADSLFSQTSQASPGLADSPLPQTQHTGDTALLARFSAMLQQELSKACSIITHDIKQDIQRFGVRIDAIESKVDKSVHRINQNSRMTADMQDRLEEAYGKIEDLENRSRRYNIRIRGLPETHTNLEDVMHTLMQELIPDIPQQYLEIDRIHRALTAPRADGLPRDIIVKPHFYKIKEKLMAAARYKQDLTLLGSQIQLFTDLAPSTVQKRRTLKPLLKQLQNCQIKYRWSFPFRLSFTYRGKNCSFSNYNDGENLLLELGIISRNRPSTPPPNHRDRALSPLWSSQRSKTDRRTPTST